MNTSEDTVLSPLPGNRLMSRNTPRLFRSPPQPHMCIQDTLKGTQTTCFINVMSWGKIAVPSQPNAPVPLYGGVEVPLSDRWGSGASSKTGNQKAFAVVVNPSVLQESGKFAKDLRERDGLIDLMLDFIEVMNNDNKIRFSRNFTVLADRDLTGELKDIWSVIQAKREVEKREGTNSKEALGDENSRPCSPQNVSIQSNAKHKRNGCLEGESSPVCKQNEPPSQAEANGDS